MEISFTVLGKPQGKARPRFDSRSGRAYTAKATRDYEEHVRLSYIQSCGNVRLSGEIEAHIIAFFPIPKSTSKSKLAAITEGKISPTVKPDVDNIIKSVLDALNGLAYKDDSAVVRVSAWKKYSESPRVIVRLIGGKENEK